MLLCIVELSEENSADMDWRCKAFFSSHIVTWPSHIISSRELPFSYVMQWFDVPKCSGIDLVTIHESMITLAESTSIFN